MKGEMMMLNTADTHDFIDQLTLEGVPWHRLTTPYGRGDELPKLLKDLSSLKNRESVESSVRKISHLIEHQGTLWHVTPFATVFLARIFRSALADASTNPVAHQVVDHIGELFAVLLKSVRDAQKLEHADPLPKFVDLLTEDSLWPDDEEDDELRWEEEEVFSDSMFYSFWFYTKEVLTNALNGLEEVPQEFTESISSLKGLL